MTSAGGGKKGDPEKDPMPSNRPLGIVFLDEISPDPVRKTMLKEIDEEEPAHQNPKARVGGRKVFAPQ